MWRDIESGEIVTREQLYAEYMEALASGIVDPMTFNEYINNSLTRNNGTLETI